MFKDLSILLLVISCCCVQPISAQESDADASRQKKPASPTTFWPEQVEWDDSIPTPKEHFGFEVGFRHLDHAQIASYMRVLAESSNRVSIQQYATTHGGRPLLLLTITSPSNHERIKEIKNQSRRLAKPNSNRVEIAELPAVINMGYGVHGDESSATNCSPLVAHYLAAAKGEKIDELLSNVVVLLDPSLNPDGFNRFANWANRYRGRVLNPDPQHAEHNQQWPPGRVNYYWFDLNRDWLPLVHPESRGRMRWYHQWKPNVVLDFHEMGTNSTYFFQPGIPERTNPLTPLKNVELTNKFGEYHAKALDARGSLYYTQESFDDFYMGKGSTYPDLHGAVGILFEQASSRGHVQENQDGLLRFHDTIANHFATSLSSLQATLDLREELHTHKREFYAESLKLAEKSDAQSYVFTCPHNRSRLQEFASVLLRHDLKCYWLKEDLEYGDSTFDARWTLVVPSQQPEFRFLKSLLMRRTNFKENIFYDVSSWTLSLAFGLNQKAIKKTIPEDQLELAKQNSKLKQDAPKFADTDVAYLIDWRDDGAQKVLAQLLRRQIRVRVAKKAFSVKTEGGIVRFGFGTLQVPLGVQEGRRAAIQNVLANAAKQGVSVTPVNTGLTPAGIDFGSNNFPVIEELNVAMWTGRPVSAYGAGEIWHLLDIRIGMPVSMISDSRFARTDLDDYTTLVIPNGRYGGVPSENWDKLKSFAERGGTVIAVGGSAGLVLGKLKPNEDATKPADKKSTEEKAEFGTIQKPFDTAATERALKLISGAIFKTNVDVTHPLAYGITKKHLAVFRNHSNFLEPSVSPFANPFVYDMEKPLMAGYCSKENVEKFKGSASVVVHPLGSGRIILMSDNPNFRGFWQGTSRVFSNAIFFGKLTR